jgi:hypothetical protein
MNESNGLTWTDVLYLPCAAALYFLLGRWLSSAFAAALAAILTILVFELLTGRKNEKKRRLILPLLIVGVIVYVVATFWRAI